MSNQDFFFDEEVPVPDTRVRTRRFDPWKATTASTKLTIVVVALLIVIIFLIILGPPEETKYTVISVNGTVAVVEADYGTRYPAANPFPDLQPGQPVLVHTDSDGELSIIGKE